MKRVLVILLCMSLCPPLPAESDSQSVHFAAHFGLSYAITTVSYGFSKRALRMSNGDAMLFSGFLTFVGGLFRQAIQPRFNSAGVWQNTAGIGAALGTAYIFSF